MSELPSAEPNKKRRKDLDRLVKEKIDDIDKQGLLARSWRWAHLRLFKNPIREVYSDWCTVHGFADRIRWKIISEGEDDCKRMRRYVTVEAYLALARLERDPGQAWNHVNSADKLLPLLVDGEDLDRCLSRLHNWDDTLKELESKSKEGSKKNSADRLALEDFKTRHEELKKEYEAERKGLHANENEGRFEKEQPRNRSEVHVSLTLRNIACKLQALRVQHWYQFNVELSLYFSLWRSYTIKLLWALIPAVFLAEFLYTGFNPEKPLWYRPFLTVSIMGFLGGCLSAKLLARDLVRRTTSLELIKVLITTRMLIGAAGAFTVYAIFGSGLISSVILQSLTENFVVLLAIGILAGFSEQLFVDSLDKSVQNLQMSGPPIIKMMQ